MLHKSDHSIPGFTLSASKSKVLSMQIGVEIYSLNGKTGLLSEQSCLAMYTYCWL